MKRICLCAVTVMLVVGLNGCKNGAKNEIYQNAWNRKRLCICKLF